MILFENPRTIIYVLQRENNGEKKDEVVIVLLNMLEVVTRDIMVDTVLR